MLKCPINQSVELTRVFSAGFPLRSKLAANADVIPPLVCPLGGDLASHFAPKKSGLFLLRCVGLFRAS